MTALFAVGSSREDGHEPSFVAKFTAADPDLIAIDAHPLYAYPLDVYPVYEYPLAFTFSNGVRKTRLDQAATPEPLSSGCFYPTDLAIDRDYVFWSCQDGTFRWVGRRGGTDATEHVERGVGSGWIAPSPEMDGVVYVTDAAGGRVRRLRTGNQKWDVLAEGLDRPTKIAVDDSGVYVGDGHTIRKLGR